MANPHHPVSIDPQELERAQKLWTHFLKAGKWSIIATALVLIGLTIAFVG